VYTPTAVGAEVRAAQSNATDRRAIVDAIVRAYRGLVATNSWQQQAQHAANLFRERFQPRDVFWRAGLYADQPAPSALPLRERRAPPGPCRLGTWLPAYKRPARGGGGGKAKAAEPAEAAQPPAAAPSKRPAPAPSQPAKGKAKDKKAVAKAKAAAPAASSSAQKREREARREELRAQLAALESPA
jgi:hypothetical protein